MAQLKVPPQKLRQIAAQIRIDVIEMLIEAQSGHSGGSLGAADLLTALYFSELNHEPKNPWWEDRDRFILSKGHICPVLYAVLARCGYFPLEELKTLRKLHTRLQGHPAKNKGLPGIEVSTGSLGQGLSIAVGIALAGKKDGKKWHVYCMTGDGELDEGSIWEAVMAGAHYHLDNLTLIVDNNNLQIDGYIRDVMNLYPLKEKFIAFNWDVVEVDGHNMEDILKGFSLARDNKGKPTVIIAKTVKGKGVSFMEDVAGWHGIAPKPEEGEKALKELREQQKAVGVWDGKI
jgi:transketolase